MDHESSLERAEWLVQRGDLRQALSVYREIELSAQSPAGTWWADLARRTGNVLDDLGRYDEALHAYATARRRAGGDQELHLLLTLNEAQVHAAQGDVAGALIQLRGLAESSALGPDLAGPVHLALGSALQASGDPLGAVGAFRVAAASPDAEVAAGALFNTGNVLTAADELDVAEDAYRRAQHLYAGLDNRAKDADCLDALGTVMAYRKRYAEALVLHDAACSIYRASDSTADLAQAEQNRAWSLLQSGRPADALATTSRSVQLHRAAGRATTAWLVQLSAIPALCSLGQVGDARTLVETSRATRPPLGAVEGAYETWMWAWLSHYEGDEQHCQAGRQVAAQVFTADGDLASARETRELPHPLPGSSHHERDHR